jgi:hypothetical protein
MARWDLARERGGMIMVKHNLINMDMNMKPYRAFVVYEEDAISSKWGTPDEILITDVVVAQAELCK